MYSVESPRRPRKNRFDNVAEPFLQRSGLPFAEVVSGEAIEGAFTRHGGLLAQNKIFSTSIVLWAFLGQVLRGARVRPEPRPSRTSPPICIVTLQPPAMGESGIEGSVPVLR